MNLEKDTLELNGALSIIVFDGITGKIKQEIYQPNLIVTSGKTWIANRILGTGGINAMGYMGIGTDSTSASASNTTLLAEVGSRAALTSTIDGSIITFNATFASSNPSTSQILREAGIFISSTFSTMLCRSTFPAVTKETTDSLSIVWTVGVA